MNLWALDNQLHSAKEVAALNGREEVVQYLDAVTAQQCTLTSKAKVAKAQERALAEAEKRIRAYQKLVNKAGKAAEKEAKAAEKRRRKSLCELTLQTSAGQNGDNHDHHHHHLIYDTCDLNHNHPHPHHLHHEPNNHIYELLESSDGKKLHHHSSTISSTNTSSSSSMMKFSELVNASVKTSSAKTVGGTIGSKMKILSGVSKRVLIRNNSKPQQQQQLQNSTNSTDTLRSNDSSRSCTNSTLVRGIRRDDQITYVPRLYGSLSVSNLVVAVEEDDHLYNNHQNPNHCKVHHQLSSPSLQQPNGRLHLKDVFHDSAELSSAADKTLLEGGGHLKVGTFNKHNKTSIKSKLLSRLNYQKSKLSKPNNSSSSSSSTNSQGGSLYRTHSEPDFAMLNFENKHQKPSSNGYQTLSSETSSIFERPGFGSVAFRGKFTPESLFFTSSSSKTSKPHKHKSSRNRNYYSAATDSAGNSDEEEEEEEEEIEEDEEDEVDSGHDHSHTDHSSLGRSSGGSRSTSGESSLTAVHKKYLSTTNLMINGCSSTDKTTKITTTSVSEIVGGGGDHSSFASDSIGSAGSLVLQEDVEEDCVDLLNLEDDLHDHHEFDLEESGENLRKEKGGHHPHHHHPLSKGDNNNGGALCASKSIPVLLFLYAQGLRQYYDVFEAEAIDIEALMLLTEADFVSLGIPLGPRRKLLNAIRQRRRLLGGEDSAVTANSSSGTGKSTKTESSQVKHSSDDGKPCSKVFETKL